MECPFFIRSIPVNPSEVSTCCRDSAAQFKLDEDKEISIMKRTKKHYGSSRKTLKIVQAKF
jgi:hypothetical protein